MQKRKDKGLIVKKNPQYRMKIFVIFLTLNIIHRYFQVHELTYFQNEILFWINIHVQVEKKSPDTNALNLKSCKTLTENIYYWINGDMGTTLSYETMSWISASMHS